MSRVAIVGGGITGLAAAFELERSSAAEIDLYEASSRLGGKVRTDVEGDLTIERGPDSLFARKPGLVETLRDLNLEPEIVPPRQSEFMMLVGGGLHRVPAGLVTLNAVRPEAIEATGFLSPRGKARALQEPSIPAGTGEDESIRAFFERRFGEEFARLVVEPLLAGTHGGEGDRLSMKALFPAYLEWEKTRGSTVPVEGVRDRPGLGPTFVSFRGGMQILVDALARSLKRTRVHLNAPLDRLPEADRILVAVPSNHALPLLPDVGLERIGYRSSAIATFAFDRDHISHPLDGTGFLVPRGEHFPITGATWSSQKWLGRAPAGTVLMRAFMRLAPSLSPRGGGINGPGQAPGDEEGVGGGENALIAQALSALRPLLDIEGQPLQAHLDTYFDALPQYEVGHLDLVADIESRLPANVWVAGTSYRGVGVPDCLRQGREAARRIAETL